MDYKEFYFILKQNVLLNILISALLYFSLVLFFVIFFYINSNRAVNLVLDDTFAGRQIFQLSSDMEVARNVESVKQQKDFYRELIKREEFETFIYHHHRVEFSQDSFRTPESFSMRYTRGDDFFSPTMLEITVIDPHYLINFPMGVSLGRNFSTEDFVTFKGNFPMVAGYDFKSFYEVGDLLNGEILGFPFQLEIIGFLDNDHESPPFMWYGDLNRSLFLPLIDFDLLKISWGEAESQEWEDFLWDYHFWFHHPWLLVDEGRESLDTTLNVINSLEQYYDVSMVFLLTSRRLFRNMTTRNIIAMNLDEIALYLGVSTLLVGTVLYYFSKIKYFRRQGIVQNLNLIGMSKYRQMRLVFLENLLITLPTLFLVSYYLVFWSNLMTIWPRISTQVSKWALYRGFVFGWGRTVDETTMILWWVFGIGLFYFLIQNIFPVWQILRLYRKGKLDD